MRWLLRALALSLLLPALALAATSKQYTAPESAITFGDSGKTYTLNTNGTTTLAGAYSGQVDRGAGSFSPLLAWTCTTEMNSAGVVGETVQWYAAPSDGTNTAGANVFITGTTASAASALTSANALLNLTYIGQIQVDSTDNTKTHTATGTTYLPWRYWQLVMWNATTKTLKATNNITICTFIPVPMEQQ